MCKQIYTNSTSYEKQLHFHYHLTSSNLNYRLMITKQFKLSVSIRKDKTAIEMKIWTHLL